MRLAAATLLSVIAIASPAQAEDEPPDVILGGGVSMTAGALGKASLFSAGLFGTAGWRAGPLILAGEASIHDVDLHLDSDPTTPGIDGLLLRAGGGVRWIAGSWEMSDPGPGKLFGFELRLDAGAAAQSYRWHDGGRLTRPEGWAGAEWQFRIRGQPARDQLIIHFGFRLALAEAYAPAHISRAICAGGCTIDPGPTAYDPSWTLNMGVEWAR